MLEGKKYRFIYYTAIILFLGYVIAVYIPGFETEDNKIYFNIWLISIMILLVIFSLLNRKKKQKEDSE